jgi:hypothetical protein
MWLEMIGLQELSEFPCFFVQLQFLSPKLPARLGDPLCSSSWMIGAHSGPSDLPAETSAADGCPEVFRGFTQSLKLTATAPSSVLFKFSCIIIIFFISVLRNVW